MTERLLFRYSNVPPPGAYIWGLLHPGQQCGFLTCVGSLLITTVAIDTACWFIVLMVGWFIVDRVKRARQFANSTSAASK